ncbi:MAG: hypothetical protein MUD10_04835 [Candidatus Pacebacteria bacterium]|jgi:predicted transcriptional regulator|nr:hypothetical protein [Candidatus Paceibacterota bacterium]
MIEVSGKNEQAETEMRDILTEFGQAETKVRHIVWGKEPEQLLARDCPQEFKEQNKWHEYAMRFMAGNRDMNNWKWKRISRLERKKITETLVIMADTSLVSYYDKKGVISWLLSDNLCAVPSLMED